jgi:hypothetical protein
MSPGIDSGFVFEIYSFSKTGVNRFVPLLHSAYVKSTTPFIHEDIQQKHLDKFLTIL